MDQLIAIIAVLALLKAPQSIIASAGQNFSAKRVARAMPRSPPCPEVIRAFAKIRLNGCQGWRIGAAGWMAGASPAMAAKERQRGTNCRAGRNCRPIGIR
ncbi:MAG: hypothetical protein ACM31L_13935 [Actinomycetota bacterium]